MHTSIQWNAKGTVPQSSATIQYVLKYNKIEVLKNIQYGQYKQYKQYELYKQ